MSDAAAPSYNPYATTPGSSTPGRDVTPEEGKTELWTFFWLSIANTIIIAGAGLIAWFLVR